jgi:hypothetical protein
MLIRTGPSCKKSDLTHKKTYSIAALYRALKTNSRGSSALLQAPRSPFADAAGIALLQRPRNTRAAAAAQKVARGADTRAEKTTGSWF